MISTVKIKGMSCNHCVMAVTEALNEVQGISNVQVDLKSGKATFEHTGPTDTALIRQVVEQAGYEIG
ncbi:MAG: heavy-metal-associated domain-containing protein [Deltaproteobacteria bacterium]|nr:heavy-metal-associated domain-containing protein [Deltaproteobacteria bacterium]